MIDVTKKYNIESLNEIFKELQDYNKFALKHNEAIISLKKEFLNLIYLIKKNNKNILINY